MSNEHGITKSNLMNTLPTVLANDKRLNALADIISDILERRTEEIGRTILYKNIDSMPSDLLDILAYDFKVDWWDSDLSVEEKRKTLKSSWHIHRLLGTRFAVENAIANIYEDSELLEWFEYSGTPYYFKMIINSGEGMGDIDKLERVINRVIYYKSLRSVFEKIQFSQTRTSVKRYIGSASYGGRETEMTMDEFDPTGLNWLIDENGITLTDEHNVFLFI